MPKLRVLSGKTLIVAFEKLGFRVIGQKGSHIKMNRFLIKIQTLIIPNHKSISKGTLKEIYTQALVYISELELKKIFYT